MMVNGYELSFELIVGGLLLLLLFFVFLLIRIKKKEKKGSLEFDCDPPGRDEATYEKEDDLFRPAEKLSRGHPLGEKEIKKEEPPSKQKAQEFLVLQWPAAGMRTCPYCGVENSPDTAECIVCAKQII